jgi:anthranilate phosphoribosyltransferase
MNISEQIRQKIIKSFEIDVFNVDKGYMDGIVRKLQKRQNLAENEVVLAMTALMSDDITQDEIAAYLTALHEKGETEYEIAASARMMRLFASSIYTDETRDKFEAIDIIDCCGTGGGVNLFNISTVVSIILAAGGLYVAKHGNRAITSKSGSADFLEELGVKLDISPEKVGECILQTKIGFLFAPLFHAATKNVQLVRRTLPHKTVFNILGPLTNPAQPAYQVIGVYDPALTEKLAHVLKLLGLKRAAVFHGYTQCGGGMDEVSLLGTTKVSELLTDGSVSTYMFDPSDVGMHITTYERLRKGTAKELAVFLCDILSGKVTGPEEEIVALNAAFAFKIAGKVTSLKEGISLARTIMRSGACDRVIREFVSFTQNC